MKKVIKIAAVLLLILIAIYFIHDNKRYSKLETKIEEFKQNENYNLALSSFKDTLPSLLKAYYFENSPKDSYSNRPLLSTGPVLFNSTFDKCAVFFALENEDHLGEKRIQEFYCYGDRRNGKWIFYQSLYGMQGIEIGDYAVEKELKQTLKQLIDEFNVITWDLKYNDHFVNCHKKGFGDPRPEE